MTRVVLDPLRLEARGAMLAMVSACTPQDDPDTNSVFVEVTGFRINSKALVPERNW